MDRRAVYLAIMLGVFSLSLRVAHGSELRTYIISVFNLPSKLQVLTNMIEYSTCGDA